MATLSTIGTSGRTYSDPVTWLSFFANGGWEGDAYKDSTFTTTSAINFNQTTSSSNYIRLGVAAGESICDNPLNALVYDNTKGVAIEGSSSYYTIFNVTTDYVTIERWQIHGNHNSIRTLIQASGNHCLFQNVLLDENSRNGGPSLALNGSATIARNIVAIMHGTQQAFGCSISNGSSLVNCTFVAPDGVTGGMTKTDYGTATVRNCAFFGYSGSITLGGGTYASDGHNATDQSAAPGSTGNQVSKPFTTATFTSATNNFRMAAGGCLDGTGVVDTTHIPSGLDFFGNTRGATWSIGADQYVSSGAAFIAALPNKIMQAVKRASYY